MGFAKKTWKDRLVEFAGRRSLTKVSGSADGLIMIVDVARNEGNISQVGDTFSADNMNGLEQRISDAFGECPTSTGIRDIQVVDILPEDAAQHPDTLYIIAG